MLFHLLTLPDSFWLLEFEPPGWTVNYGSDRLNVSQTEGLSEINSQRPSDTFPYLVAPPRQKRNSCRLIFNNLWIMQKNSFLVFLSHSNPLISTTLQRFGSNLPKCYFLFKGLSSNSNLNVNLSFWYIADTSFLFVQQPLISTWTWSPVDFKMISSMRSLIYYENSDGIPEFKCLQSFQYTLFVINLEVLWDPRMTHKEGTHAEMNVGHGHFCFWWNPRIH